MRAKNSDALKGKSGGYRLSYYVNSETEVVLVTLYSKTEQADIAVEDIRELILNLEETPAPDLAPEQQANAADPDAPADQPRD